MAVYTKLSFDDISSHLLEHYNIGELLNFQEINEGVENSNFLIFTSKDKFILTIFEERVNKKYLNDFMKIKYELNQHNFTCPIPIKNNNNNYITKILYKDSAIVSFLEGKSIQNVDEKHCYQLGESLSRFHNITMDLKYDIDNSFNIHNIGELYNNVLDKIDHEYRLNITNELERLKSYKDVDLPKGMIHADLFKDNVFFLNNNIHGFIDFYFSCYDVLLYDIAICIVEWCFEDKAINSNNLKQFLKGYNSNRTIDSIEYEYMNLYCNFVCLRFLYTRYHDWFYKDENVIKKDPKEYYNKFLYCKNNNILDIINS